MRSNPVNFRRLPPAFLAAPAGARIPQRAQKRLIGFGRLARPDCAFRILNSAGGAPRTIGARGLKPWPPRARRMSPPRLRPPVPSPRARDLPSPAVSSSHRLAASATSADRSRAFTTLSAACLFSERRNPRLLVSHDHRAASGDIEQTRARAVGRCSWADRTGCQGVARFLFAPARSRHTRESESRDAWCGA